MCKYVCKKGLCKGYAREYLHKIWLCMVQYLQFKVRKFPRNPRKALAGARLQTHSLPLSHQSRQHAGPGYG